MTDDRISLIEFYRNGHEKYIESVRASMVPREGDKISILGVTYEVVRVTWALDRCNQPGVELRANVDLEVLPND